MQGRVFSLDFFASNINLLEDNHGSGEARMLRRTCPSVRALDIPLRRARLPLPRQEEAPRQRELDRRGCDVPVGVVDHLANQRVPACPRQTLTTRRVLLRDLKRVGGSSPGLASRLRASG